MVNSATAAKTPATHSPASRQVAGGEVLSMTGFAMCRGEGEGRTWVWDIRSVNGKGLDLRLRLPEGIDGLEPAVRAAIARVAQRGNVSVSLRLSGDEASGRFRPNPATLAAALAALKAVETAAFDADLSLTPASMAEVLMLRGVLDQPDAQPETGALLVALLSNLDPCLEAFRASRQSEGAALARVIGAQIDRVAGLTAEAATAAEARRPAVAEALNEALARVMTGAPEADPQRIAQELAFLAVKADVTEELDRLRAHVDAAHALLAEGGAIGRKFDFLMQEFMREANTLCSKSGDKVLTRIGLDLKTVIDQMREQVQNIE